jgi:hypothetical protein
MGFRDYSIGVNLIGRDVSASKALDKLGKKARTTGSQLEAASKKATLVLAAFAGAAAKFAKAAADDEKGAVSLAQTLTNVTRASKKQVQNVEDFIGKAEMFSTVADDEIRPAFDRLVRSTKNIGEAQKLTNLALEISAKKGLSVESVANAIAKAHDGNVGALKKIGIAVPKATAAQKVYATKLKVVNGQLKEVQVQVGKTEKGTISFSKVIKQAGKDFKGSISGQSETAAYKMAQFQRAMDRTQETLGYMLLPYLKDFADWLIKVEPFIKRNKDNIKKIAIAILGMAAAIKTVNGAIKIFYALQSVKAFAAILARWAGFTAVVETTGATMVATGAAVQIAWLPFLATIGAIAAAAGATAYFIDKAQKKREALIKDPKKQPAWIAGSKNPIPLNTEMRATPGTNIIPPSMSSTNKPEIKAINPSNKSGGVTIINNIHGSVLTENELAANVRNNIAQLLRRKGLSTAILGL